MVAVANNRKTSWTEREFYKTIGKNPRFVASGVTPLATPSVLETELSIA
jgi:hypothetical protein